MTPGVSVIYVGGSEIILNPEIDLVTQGTPPVLAPDLFVCSISESFFLRELMMVDLPTFGTPPIMHQPPTVLNYGYAFLLINYSNLLMLMLSLVERVI